MLDSKSIKKSFLCQSLFGIILFSVSYLFGVKKADFFAGFFLSYGYVWVSLYTGKAWITYIIDRKKSINKYILLVKWFFLLMVLLFMFLLFDIVSFFIGFSSFLGFWLYFSFLYIRDYK